MLSNHYGQAFEHGAQGHAMNQKTSQKVTDALSITKDAEESRTEKVAFVLLCLTLVF